MFSFRILSLLLPAVAILASLPCVAQLSIGSDANSLVIKSGETFNYEGLSLTPSSDFSLSNTTLTRTDAKTISPSPGVDYIARYFSFSNTTPGFSGTIRFSYAGATLSPLSAGSLELNIRANAGQWINISGTDNGSSYVEATVTGPQTLNILTLGSTLTPLPVSWLEFTAINKDNTAVLTWITASEQNTQDYVVQHGFAGSWKTLGMVKAAGNSATPLKYSYTHTTPQKGHNLYRLIQRDRDGKQTFSEIASVWMGENSPNLIVSPNPVQNRLLKITAAEPTQIALFDATGRKVGHQKLKEGSHTMDVSGLPGGLYRLQAGTEVIPVIIP